MSKPILRLPPPSDLSPLRRSLLAWHRRHGLRAPWRSSGDPYLVMVAAVMAQQTQISRVLQKFGEFIAAFPTVEALAKASTARVLRMWEGMGYNLRGLRLHRAAKRIVRQGGFPRRAAELVEIEGIGPFTAAIITSFAFGEPVAAIDVNVRRVLIRLLTGESEARLSDRALQPAADALISRRAPGRWNQAMMDLGARVCKPRAPQCNVCPLATWCRARPLFESRNAPRRVAEAKASYRAQAPFRGSRRYYRGRIVQALRELPRRVTITPADLLARLAGGGLNEAELRDLIEALRRDGLLRINAKGRLRLP
ncbi:MAG: A/G-specific adenine glycosylase [Chloroflexi bacterium]|nr:A/G-specific adenine glycosylase [Chloroflexota bacterium]